MDLTAETITQTLTLTQSAADAVKKVLAEKNLEGYALRLFVSGSGCCGNQFGLALDNRFRSEDIVVETDGIKLIIDEVSIQYLQGVTVDYVDDGETSGFKIVTANPISTCSCGQDTSSQSETDGGCAGCR